VESSRDLIDLITRVGVDRGGSEQVSVVVTPPEPIATAAAAGRRPGQCGGFLSTE